MKIQLKQLLSLLMGALIFPSVSSAQEECADGPFTALYARYEQLSPKGKFATGAAVGFVGSRLAFNTAVRVAKVGAAVYIGAEVLKLTGIMDDIPALSDEQQDMITKVKGRVLATTNDFRISVRRRFSKEGVEDFFEKERMAALGLASGAFAGTLF